MNPTEERSTSTLEALKKAIRPECRRTGDPFVITVASKARGVAAFYEPPRMA